MHGLRLPEDIIDRIHSDITLKELMEYCGPDAVLQHPDLSGVEPRYGSPYRAT